MTAKILDLWAFTTFLVLYLVERRFMAAKTYIPQLRFVLNVTNRYATRWQTKLEANLTAPQYTCLLAVISAITDCLIALGPAPIGE